MTPTRVATVLALTVLTYFVIGWVAPERGPLVQIGLTFALFGMLVLGLRDLSFREKGHDDSSAQEDDSLP